MNTGQCEGCKITAVLVDGVLCEKCDDSTCRLTCGYVEGFGSVCYP
jgi:hypothetical protein